MSEVENAGSPLRHLRVPSLYTIGFLSITAAIFFRSLGIEIDGDLWFHLANGRRMTELGAIRIPEWISFTATGEQFVNQWWLAQLASWRLYRSFGLWSIFIISSLLVALSFVFVYLRMLSRGSSRSVALTVFTVGAIASSVSWGPRPQMISLLLTSLFLWLLEHFDRSSRWEWLVPIPLLMALWSNSHGGFVVGIALLAIPALSSFIEGGRDKARALTIALAATSLATLAGPYGIRQWQYPLQFMFPNPYLNMIQESRSPDFHLPAFLPFEILLIALIVSALWAPHRRWRDILLIIAFTHLALTQIRHIALWVVVVSPMIAEYASAAVRTINARIPALAGLNRTPAPAVRTTLNAALIIMVSVLYWGVFSRALMSVDPERAERRIYPAGAADHLGRAPSRGRTFTTFEWGGYVGWRLSPRQKVFIDARADALYDERILMDYVTIMRLLPGWRRQVDQWDIDQFVIPRGSILERALENEPSWRRTYADHNAVIFVRRTAAPNAG